MESISASDNAHIAIPSRLDMTPNNADNIALTWTLLLSRTGDFLADVAFFAACFFVVVSASCFLRSRYAFCLAALRAFFSSTVSPGMSTVICFGSLTGASLGSFSSVVPVPLPVPRPRPERPESDRESVEL